jgi:hypothetical protein
VEKSPPISASPSCPRPNRCDHVVSKWAKTLRRIPQRDVEDVRDEPDEIGALSLGPKIEPFAAVGEDREEPPTRERDEELRAPRQRLLVDAGKIDRAGARIVKAKVSSRHGTSLREAAGRTSADALRCRLFRSSIYYRPSRAFGAAVQLAVIGEGAGVEASRAVALAMADFLLVRHPSTSDAVLRRDDHDVDGVVRSEPRRRPPSAPV